MFGGWAMPVWYMLWRYPIMVLQIFLGTLIQTQGMPRRLKSRWLHALALALCAAACFFVVWLEYRDGEFQCHYMVINFTMYFLLVLTVFALYRVSIGSAALAAANGYLTQEMGGALKTALRLLFPALQDMASHTAGVLLMDFLSYITLYFVLWLCLRKRVRRTDYLRESHKMFAAVLALLIGIGMSSMTRGHDASVYEIFPDLADNLYLIGSGALLMAFQVGLAGQLRALWDVATMKEVIREQSIQYEASRETAQLLNEKYHDLKQMIGALQGRITAEELERLDKSVSAYGAHLHTGSEVLDVLLTEKQLFCDKNDIRITTMVDGADLGFVETLDLYALFSNAITNAIGAVSRLPEGMDRFIILNVSRSGQMILIHMENPCVDELVFRDGLPVTSGDKEYHGFGMKSMERVAEKYNGTLAAAQSGGMFTLDILLVDSRQ